MNETPPEGTVFEPSAGTINFSCFVFAEVGREFELAARLFEKEHEGFSLVPYFLFSQALELGLKAFLLWRGFTREQLRLKGGHSLVVLLTLAEAQGLTNFVAFTADEKAIVDVATKYYAGKGAASKRFQYMDVFMAGTAFKGLPDLDALGSVVGRLLHNPDLEEAYRRA